MSMILTRADIQARFRDDAERCEALAEAADAHRAALEQLHRDATDRSLTASEQRRWDGHQREKDDLEQAHATLDRELRAEKEDRAAARRAKWGSTQVAPGQGRSYPDNGEHRYGAWLADVRDNLRANTVDVSTTSGLGRNPLGNQNVNSWFDLVRPQSKLLDSFNWQRIVTDRAQVDVPHVKSDGPATATNEGADITGNAGSTSSPSSSRRRSGRPMRPSARRCGAMRSRTCSTGSPWASSSGTRSRGKPHSWPRWRLVPPRWPPTPTSPPTST